MTDSLWASSITLIVGGIVAIPVVVALADQLGTREPQFARVGLVLGLVAALGSALHGAWDTPMPAPCSPRTEPAESVGQG
jgi:hypothetical protein